MEYALNPKYTRGKSFYGKAKVVEEYNSKSLISYKSCICQIQTNSNDEQVVKIYDVHDYYGRSLTFSNTSLRHLRDFLLQNDLPAANKADILNRYTIVEGGQVDA